MFFINDYPPSFRNDNPDKGTETILASMLMFLKPSFRNDNPDKGTETSGKALLTPHFI